MSIRPWLAVLTLGAGLTPAAQAAVSYTHVEAEFQSAEILADLGAGLIDDSGSGYALRASYGVTENVFVSFDHQTSSPTSGVDITDMALGIGFLTHGSDSTDAYVKLNYASAELEAGPASADDGGVGLEFGVRGRWNERLELEAHFGYTDLGDFGTFRSYGYGLAWQLTDQLDLTGGLERRANEDVKLTNLQFGLRYRF